MVGSDQIRSGPVSDSSTWEVNLLLENLDYQYLKSTVENKNQFDSNLYIRAMRGYIEVRT
jgi:hypothetical protein